MKKALKVIVDMACVCGGVALLLYEAHDAWIQPKIDKIKEDTWREAWDNGYKYGCIDGRIDVLCKAYFKGLITLDEYDELIKN